MSKILEKIYNLSSSIIQFSPGWLSRQWKISKDLQFIFFDFTFHSLAFPWMTVSTSPAVNDA